MSWKKIEPAGLAKPIAPYSLGARTQSGLVASAGFVALAADGSTVGLGDAGAQTRFILETIQKVLEAASSSMSDVFMVQMFIKDFADYSAVNDVYKQFFSDPYPARFCVRADLLKPEWLVEIAVTAGVK